MNRKNQQCRCPYCTTFSNLRAQERLLGIFKIPNPTLVAKMGSLLRVESPPPSQQEALLIGIFLMITYFGHYQAELTFKF